MFRNLFKFGRSLRRLVGRPTVFPQARRVSDRRLWVEELEPRLVLDCSIGIINRVLTVSCIGGPYTVTVDHSGPDAIVNGRFFNDSLYDWIDVRGGSGGLITNIYGNVKHVQVVDYAFADPVNIGKFGSLSGITAPVSVFNPPSFSYLNIDDSADGTPHNSVTVTADSIYNLAAPIYYRQSDLLALNISTGTNSNVVDVLSTPSNYLHPHTALIGHALPWINGLVAVGSTPNPYTSTLSGIQGQLDVSSSVGRPSLLVRDAADNGTHPNVVVTVNSITGLAPAPITYQSTLSDLSIEAGYGDTTINVQSTFTQTSLTGGGHTTVNVGNAGRLSDIWGLLDLRYSAALNVDNSADGLHHSNVAVRQIDFETTRITGLAPADIIYDVSTVTISTGIGSNVVNVLSTPSGLRTRLIGHSPTTTVNVGNSTDGVQEIRGSLEIRDTAGLAVLVVDDSANTMGRTATLSVNGAFGVISGLAPANITYLTAEVGWLVVNGGRGGNVFNVEGLSSAARRSTRGPRARATSSASPLPASTWPTSPGR
jgi:hypothetical protein